MLNLLTKTKPWMVASVLAATSAFGQNNKCPPQSCSKPCEKVCPEPMQAPTIAAYNAPAGIDTRCSWDVFIDAAFIYWQPIEENLELAIIDGPAGDSSDGNVVNMSFSYKPGFKVGLGFSFDYDNWDIYGEYTRFHGSHSQSASVSLPVTADNGLAPTSLAPAVVQDAVFGSISQSWRLNMDIADLILGREYYVGTKLTFKTLFGARGAWIRQTLSDTYSDGLGGDDAVASATASQSSHSWAVGPRAGLNTSWLLGEGFRFIGNGAADILYTRYTTLQNNSSSTIDDTTVTLSTTQKNMGYLRTHVEMEMGFGWGSYFDNNNWHFDLAATYGFQTFFNQNMFRQYSDDVATGSSFVPNGNLYVHGLNLVVRFDF